MKLSTRLAEKIRAAASADAAENLDSDLLGSLTRQALGGPKPEEAAPLDVRKLTQADWEKYGPRRTKP